MLALSEGAADDHVRDGLSAADDYVHPVSADPWETETCWFSFYERSLALTGYLYVIARPNLGVCSGGALLWDDSAFLPWEVPHFDYQWHLPNTLKPGDSLVATPVGVSVEVLEPLRRYAVRYDNRGMKVDLEFTGFTPAHTPQPGDPPFAKARHLDQPGRVVGTLVHGDRTVPIDCLAMRDRSWGPRDDQRPGRFGYTLGFASETHGFLSYSKPRPNDDRLFAGFYLRDGTRARIITGHRSVSREPETGAPTLVRIEGSDELGRTFTASGEALNRLCFTPYPRMLNWTTTLTWVLDGEDGLGEDQDVWPIERWAGR